MTTRVGYRTRAITALVCALLNLSCPCWAALGDNTVSVLVDRAHMKGILRSVDAQRYVMHEITTPAGMVVREFASPSGTVFGVAWEGAFLPDLQQLLGPYYEQAKRAVAQNPRRGRAPIVIETEGLVLYQSGHMRSFNGQAYIPRLVPKQVQVSEIH